MKPAKTGIARLSSTCGNIVSTNVAIAAIGIMIIQLSRGLPKPHEYPMTRYPINRSTTNSAMTPSHAVSLISLIQ